MPSARRGAARGEVARPHRPPAGGPGKTSATHPEPGVLGVGGPDPARGKAPGGQGETEGQAEGQTGDLRRRSKSNRGPGSNG